MKSLKTILIYLAACAPSLMAMNDQAALEMPITDRQMLLLTSQVAWAKEKKWVQDYEKRQEERDAHREQEDKKLQEALNPRKNRIMEKLAQIAPEAIATLTDAAILQTMEAHPDQQSDEGKRCNELFNIMHLIFVDDASNRTLNHRLNVFHCEYLSPRLEKIPLSDDETRYRDYWALIPKRNELTENEAKAKRKAEDEEYFQKRRRIDATKETRNQLVDTLIPEDRKRNKKTLNKIAAICQLTDAQLLQRLAINSESDQKLYDTQDHIEVVLDTTRSRLFDYAQAGERFIVHAEAAINKLWTLRGRLQLRILQYAASAKNEIVEFEQDCIIHHAITPNDILGMNDAMIYPLFGILPTTDLEGLLRNKKGIKAKHKDLNNRLSKSFFPNDPNQDPALKRINDKYEQLTQRMDLLQE